jgi:GAF domain-containing protein
MSTARDIVYLPPEQMIPETPGKLVQEERITEMTSERTFTHDRSPQFDHQSAELDEQFGIQEAEQKRGGFNATPALALSPRTGKLKDDLGDLANLIANITEAYTATIFVADNEHRVLSVGAAHTLSRNFVQNAIIEFGNGLVGWTAENEMHVSVCPFEHDATTLLYYSQDQELKSFIAVPIINAEHQLVGVITCDSKKSYAFPKITEKLLHHCASQAATIIDLHKQVNTSKVNSGSKGSELLMFLTELQSVSDEPTLLQTAANLPDSLIDRDALVVMTTEESGVGRGKFYSTNGQSRTGHRLLELVCKHKKIICGDRTVQALPTDDIQQRSFLSVPIRVLGRESGSFNLISRPQAAFDAIQISALEKISDCVGKTLERIRLKERFATALDTNGITSWKHFAIQGMLKINEATNQKSSLTLIRLALTNLSDVEEIAGVEATTQSMDKIMRLADQLKGNGSIACYLYGFQILVLIDSKLQDSFISRLENLIERITISDLSVARAPLNLKLGKLLLQGLRIVTARTPKDGETLSELCLKTQRLLKVVTKESHQNGGANARSWS